MVKNHRLKRSFSPGSVRQLLAMLAVSALFGTQGAAADAESSARFYEDALQRYESGDYEAAVVQLKNAVEAESTNISARILLGKSYLISGNPVAARKEFRIALNAGADESSVLVPLGSAMLLQLKYEDLLDNIRPGRRSPDVESSVWMLRGEALLGLGKLREADEAFEESVLLAPNSVAGRLGQVSVHLRTGNLDDAERIANEARVLAPDSVEPLFLLAEVALARGNTAEGGALLDQVLERAPGHTDARLRRATLLLDSGEVELALIDVQRIRVAEPNNMQAAYLAAAALARSGDSQRAREAMQELSRAVVGLDPDLLDRHPSTMLVTGYVKYMQGNSEEAGQLLQRYVAIEPRHLGARKLLASIMIARGEPLSAVEVLEPVLTIHGSDPGLYRVLGRAYTVAGKHSRAARAFDRAVELDPEQTALLTERAVSNLSAGRVDEAVSDLEDVLLMDRSAKEPGYLLAQVLLGRGEFDRVLEIVDTLSEAEPDNPAVPNLAGGAWFGKGEWYASRQSFNAALKLDPEFVPARLNLGHLALIDGDIAGARAAFESILEDQPNEIGALVALATIDEREGRIAQAIEHLETARSADRGAIVAQLRLVALYIQQGEADQAMRIANDLEQVAPDNVAVVTAVGRARLAQGERPQALSTYRRASRLAGSSPVLLTMVASQQRLAGDTENARWSLVQALQADSSYVPARVALARLELESGRSEESRTHVEVLREALPESPVGDQLLGDVLMEEGEYAGAAEAFSRAQSIGGSEALMLRRFAALLDAGAATQAIAEMEQWIDLHPGGRSPRVALAYAHARAGRNADAIAVYESLLTDFPSDSEVLNNLAWLYLRIGDPRASEVAERAYKLAPSSPSVLDTFGWVLVSIGESDRGLAVLREAHSRAIGDPTIRFHLASALVKLGRRTAEARKHLADALESKADFEERRAAQSLLEELNKDKTGD